MESQAKGPTSVQFYVASISCISCTPVFGRNLRRLEGVLNVRESPMFNKIGVEFDPTTTSADRVKEGILNVAEKAGFKGKIVMLSQ
jgi:copper chaperone CopZ